VRFFIKESDKANYSPLSAPASGPASPSDSVSAPLNGFLRNYVKVCGRRRNFG